VDVALTVNTVLFHPDGSRLAVKHKDGFMSVWQIDDPRRPPWQIPTGLGVDPLGFTPGRAGHLVTTDAYGVTGLQIWDLRTAQRVAQLTAPIGSELTLRGTELGVFTDGYARVLRLDPELWFTRLCALADRPFTAKEILLLRERAAPLTRPCG
jgi:hypothetical protein